MIIISPRRLCHDYIAILPHDIADAIFFIAAPPLLPPLFAEVIIRHIRCRRAVDAFSLRPPALRQTCERRRSVADIHADISLRYRPLMIQVPHAEMPPLHAATAAYRVSVCLYYTLLLLLFMLSYAMISYDISIPLFPPSYDDVAMLHTIFFPPAITPLCSDITFFRYVTYCNARFLPSLFHAFFLHGFFSATFTTYDIYVIICHFHWYYIFADTITLMRLYAWYITILPRYYATLPHYAMMLLRCHCQRLAIAYTYAAYFDADGAAHAISFLCSLIVVSFHIIIRYVLASFERWFLFFFSLAIECFLFATIFAMRSRHAHILFIAARRYISPLDYFAISWHLLPIYFRHYCCFVTLILMAFTPCRRRCLLRDTFSILLEILLLSFSLDSQPPCYCATVIVVDVIFLAISIFSPR